MLKRKGKFCWKIGERKAADLEACREELESVLEGWLLLSAADHSPIPEIGGGRIEIRITVLAFRPPFLQGAKSDRFHARMAIGFREER